MKKSHGMSKTRFYSIWSDMKKRCTNKKSVNYKFYGEKGIIYQESWEFFENFLKDMFDEYSDKLTLDRIDPTKNYCKENCRWILPEVQNKNKSTYSNNSLGESNIFIVMNKGVETLCASLVNDKGFKVRKRYSLKKYTFEQAVVLAKKWLHEKRKEFSYFEKHGVKR